MSTNSIIALDENSFYVSLRDTKHRKKGTVAKICYYVSSGAHKIVGYDYVNNGTVTFAESRFRHPPSKEFKTASVKEINNFTDDYNRAAARSANKIHSPK